MTMRIPVTALALVLVLSPMLAAAGPVQLGSYTFASAGGAMAGPQYSLFATLGQGAAVGVASDEDHVLVAGFAGQMPPRRRAYYLPLYMRQHGG